MDAAKVLEGQAPALTLIGKWGQGRSLTLQGVKKWLSMLALLAFVATASAQEVAVWGWRAKGWVELFNQEFGIAAEILAGEEGGNVLPVDAFDRYKLVIISEGRPENLTPEQHEKVRQYLENGGFLLLNTISVSGIASNGENVWDLSPAENWLGAGKYAYGTINAEIMEPEHPALAHLQQHEWFAAKPGLTHLTTARCLIGLDDNARVLVNRVGKGGVLFISPEVGSLHVKDQEPTEDAKALFKMIRVFVESIFTGTPPVDAVFGSPVTSAELQRRNLETMAQVRQGKNTLPIVIVATEESKSAADVLTKYLEASLGKKVLAKAPADGAPVFRIHVGRTPYVDSLNLDFSTLHPFGYYLKLADDKNLVLAGSGVTKDAATYAVYDFLKRSIGYRYFAPGELGEIVPPHPFLELPDSLDAREEPSIASYTNAGFYGGNGAFSRSWRTTLYATHVLGRIVPPAKYGKTHPEYFPMYDGKRFIPGEKLGGTWQPCVTNPDLPKLAIEWAKEYFKEKPEALGFPLGVNDGGGDCRCPDCLKAKETYGNQYIPFYNATARLAKKEFPGKYVGFIAYGGARPAPKNIRLEDNLLVEVTGGMADDMKQMKDWRAAGAKNFGLYDYLYGYGYVVPRHYPHLLAKTWKSVAEEYGMNSFWGESFIKSWYFDGPRQYVVNELAWNLNAPVDDLLKDYFENFYGPAAAPMQAIFAKYEEIYMRKAEPLYPIGDWKGWQQLKEFTASDLADIRAHLEKAASLVEDGSVYARRLALFEKLWCLSELFVNSHLTVQQVEKLKGGEQDWDKIVARGYEIFREIEAFSLSPEDEKALFSHQGLAQYKGHERLKMRPELEMAVDRFFQRTDKALGEKADAFLQAEVKRAASDEACFLAESHLLEKQTQGEARKNLFAAGQNEQAKNAVSEDWKNISDVMPGWSTWSFPNSKTVFEVSNEGTPDGTPAMIIRQNDIRGSFLRTRQVWPGERFRIRFMVKQAKGDKPGNLTIRWKGKDGNWLPSENEGSQAPIIQRCPQPDGTWQEVSVLFTVPEGARSITVLLSAPDGQPATSAIWFHDVALYKVHDMRSSGQTTAGLKP